MKGGVPLSRTFSTALVCAQEAGNACTQNDKKGVPWNPRNPLDPPLQCLQCSSSGFFRACADYVETTRPLVNTLLVEQVWRRCSTISPPSPRVSQLSLTPQSIMSPDHSPANVCERGVQARICSKKRIYVVSCVWVVGSFTETLARATEFVLQ